MFEFEIDPSAFGFLFWAGGKSDFKLANL